MERAGLLRRQLLEAEGVAGVLAAGWEIFQFAMAVAAAGAGQADGLFAGFTFARGAAVSGRNALALAPSLPAGLPVPAEDPVMPAGQVEEAAGAVAGLASALGARLREVAGLAADAGDRAACLDAARDADRIGELLARGA